MCIIITLVSWANAHFYIDDTHYVPVELGLLKCFSEACEDGKFALVHIYNSHPDGSTKHPVELSRDGYYTTDISQSVPFENAGIVTMAFLSMAILFAVITIALEVIRMSGNIGPSRKLPFYTQVVMLVFACLAPATYVLMTFESLKGGNYTQGLW
eukprot:CAMPEP_0117772332 /NCGR_PEP_ID=MMETSP0947-20121206/25022_1 /TAXON_ID=44440 /ORGANISM="Chattonella subsalsa, Strain CCMP2191" /LENGTH=154 /DNA_ID=CAMNT_0005597913 /DNA_START=507 /DNA_END=968 /DNA_ORIENTATION=+